MHFVFYGEAVGRLSRNKTSRVIGSRQICLSLVGSDLEGKAKDREGFCH